MMQELFVIMIICAAVAYIGRCAWSVFRGGTACGGCGSCGKSQAKSLLTIQPLISPRDAERSEAALTDSAPRH